MRSEKEVYDIVLNFAKTDKRIRMVTLEGSRTNTNIPPDDFQDFDITFFVTDIHPVLLFCIEVLGILRCLFSCRLVCIFLMFRLKYGPEIRMLLVNTIQNYTGLKIQHQPLLYSDIYFCVQVRL